MLTDLISSQEHLKVYQNAELKNSKNYWFMNESDPRSDVHYLGSSENKA